MSIRTIAAIVLLSVLSTCALAAQSTAAGQSRVRVTALRHYQIPGVVTIDGDQVTGRSVTMDKTMIRVPSASGQLISILKPGTRVTGSVEGVTDGVLSLLVDGQRDPFNIPLNSLAKIELSDRAGKRHLARGILAGIGTFYGVLGLSLLRCGLGCDDALGVAAIAAGIGVGTLTGHSREHWAEVSPAEFRLRFATVSSSQWPRTLRAAAVARGLPTA
jgi:hypothetical protein